MAERLDEDVAAVTRKMGGLDEKTVNMREFKKKLKEVQEAWAAVGAAADDASLSFRNAQQKRAEKLSIQLQFIAVDLWNAPSNIGAK